MPDGDFTSSENTSYSVHPQSCSPIQENQELAEKTAHASSGRCQQR